MQQDKLTLDDIQQLIAALKCWETEPSQSGFSTSLLGIMLTGLAPEDEREDARNKVKQDSERARLQAVRDCDIRREQSILLQVKLIQLKNEILSGGDVT